MGLMARLALQEPVETWPSLDLAASERYWDGLELAAAPAGRNTGAVYLLGYVVEILLKVAFFRQRGWQIAQSIDREVIRTHAAWRGGRNFHDLEALANLLIEERRQRGVPLDPVFGGELLRHVLVLTSHWRETLRYRHSVASENEVNEVLQSADWVLDNRNLL